MPPQQGPGRRRTMCTTCSPPDTRARRLNPVTSLPTRLAEPTTPGAPEAAGTLTEATRDALVAVGRLDCPEGALAVMLATQLDAGGHTGSQTAALSKEYRAALDVASKGATGAASTLDQIRARRAARRGA